ncbi:PAS domain-containing protein, partial [Acinetobacter baumannii]
MWRLSGDVMLVARPDGEIAATNPAWTTLLGWSERQLHGTELQEFVVPADLPVLAAALRELAAAPASSRLFEIRLKAADGSSRTIAWSAV